MSSNQQEEKVLSVAPDRALVRVVKVEAIRKMADPKTGQPAQSVELATVMGWNVVAKMNEFQVGDLAIYFSLDTVLPKSPPTDFLEGKRLNTRRILGSYSQGLLLPLSDIEVRKKYLDTKHPKYDKFMKLETSNLKVDQNLTDFFGAEKYVSKDEQDLYNTGSDSQTSVFTRGLVRKTDEERVQNMPTALEQMVGKKVVFLKKYDGTSTTFVTVKQLRMGTSSDKSEEKKDELVFVMCGRNKTVVDPKKDGSHYFEMEKKYNIKEKMLKLGLEIAIQGETCGPKINGNKMKLQKNDFFVFNIYDIQEQAYVSWDRVLEICKLLELKTVDPVETAYLKIKGFDFDGTMTKELADCKTLLTIAEDLEYSKGVIAEGFVVKTNYGPNYPCTSLKVISNKFLLKYNL